MKHFKYIYEENDIVKYDKYFSYLSEIESNLPPRIKNFFCNQDRYSLNSDLTLHDAWVSSVNVSNQYTDNSLNSDVKLNLLLYQHNKRLEIIYGGVSNFVYDNQPAFWIDKSVDLLHHELNVLEESFIHTKLTEIT